MNRDTFVKWLNRYAEARIDMYFLSTRNESYEEPKRVAQKAKQKLLKFHKDWYRPFIATVVGPPVGRHFEVQVIDDIMPSKDK